MPRFILAIDQGTTGSTVLLVSERAEVLGRGSREFPQHFPQPGWVEHDVEQIWQSVAGALTDALGQAQLRPEDCVAIGITNQRETTVLWDRESGRAVHRAIVWQDRRTSGHCDRLRAAGLEPLFRDRTGLVLDPYFSGTKVAWLLNEVPGLRAQADAGKLAFGTLDSYLVHRLTGGQRHVTDASNASRTLMYDIHQGAWDAELCQHLGVPLAVLPEVGGNAEVYGHTRGVAGLPDGIPIAGMAGDQQAALFGQTCFQSGEAKCTYGTGAFLLRNTGEQPRASQNGLLTTVAWRLGGRTTYALEGSAFVAGSAVQWLRDQLGLVGTAAEVESLAASVPSSEGVVFVPALTGLGAPYWDPEARGLLMGLSRGSGPAHIARATLEGIAFQIADLASAMAADAGEGNAGQPTPAHLRVDGGASKNNLMMQFQADILDVPIDRPAQVETTALGAAYLAGLGVGLFASMEEIASVHRIERTFVPQLAHTDRQAHLSRWRDAVERCRSQRA